MTRPESHRDQFPEKCCRNCRHGIEVIYKRDLLCFHDDVVYIEPVEPADRRLNDERHVTLYRPRKDPDNGDSVDLMDGEEYSEVWAGRVVDDTDICDEWEPKG